MHEQGSASSLSIRQVTKRAGVSPMALYLHFDSLADLVGALIDHGFTRFRAALHAAADAVPGDDPRARLRALGLAYLRFAREEPAIYAVIFGAEHERQQEAGEPDQHGVGAAAFQDLVDAIVAVQAVRQGREGDPRMLAMGLWTNLHGFATLCEVSDNEDMPWPDDETFVGMISDAWLS